MPTMEGGDRIKMPFILSSSPSQASVIYINPIYYIKMDRTHIFFSTVLMALSLNTSAETIEINGTERQYEVIKSEQPAPGVTYSRLRFTDSSFQLNVNMIVTDLSNPGCRVETWCAKESSRGIEAITSAASRLTSENLKPVAAANGNFWYCYGQNEYPTYNYIPRLLSIRNGVLVTELNTGREKWDGGAKRNGAVGITSDGHIYVDYFTPDYTLKMPTRKMNINLCNKGVSAKYATAGELGIYNSYYGRDTKFMYVEIDENKKLIIDEEAADATEVLLDIDEGESWMTARDISFTVKSVKKNAPAGTLGDHDLALVARGTTKAKRLAELKVGDKVQLNYSFLVTGSNVTPQFEQAICGNALVMRDGELTEHNYNEEYNSMIYSRTAYGCDADNRKLYIIVIDKSTDPVYGKSRGCTTAEMCQIARHFGCSNLANFDAGGSAEMMYDGKIINTTTEATPRDVANGLMIFSTGMSAAIDTVISENSSAAPVEWYSIDGRRLSTEPTASGMYVRRRGNSSEKIFIEN